MTQAQLSKNSSFIQKNKIWENKLVELSLKIHVECKLNIFMKTT